MCAANQKGPYYDIWALRHKNWCAEDCWAQFKFLKKYSLDFKKNLEASLYSKMITIPQDSEWIEVDSAFGGFAIYKKSAFDYCEYIGISEVGEEFCEHTYFHKKLKDNGAKLFINPALINAGLTEHTVHMENTHRVDLDIVYINLDKSTERMVSMEKKLSQFFEPSDFKRFPAIQGDQRDAKISKNELGCFLSHFEVIKLSSPNNPTLILEDDVKFCKNFNTYLKNILKGLPGIFPEWDILFLAQMTDIGEVKKTAQLLKIKKNIKKGIFRILDGKSHYVSSCSAYVINPRSKDKLINLLKENELKSYPLPIDICFKRALDNDSINCKFIFPYLTGLEGLDTSIEKTEHKANVSRLLEDQLNLFFADSNPSDLIKNSLDNSIIESNQDAYLASLILLIC